MRERIAALITAHQGDTFIDLQLDFGPAAPVGLVVHRGYRGGLVKRVMTRTEAIVIEKGRLYRFAADQAKTVTAIRQALIASLAKLAQKPISQRHVERLLAISSAERLRWSKAGWLPVSGSAMISRGSSRITLATYPPVAMEDLMACPEVIESWRQADVRALEPRGPCYPASDRSTAEAALLNA
jgi:hypothetical protein